MTVSRPVIALATALAIAHLVKQGLGRLLFADFAASIDDIRQV